MKKAEWDLYKSVDFGVNFISFYKTYENADDLKNNLDGIVLSHFDSLPDPFNGGYTGYLFDKNKNQVRFVKVSNEFLEEGKKGRVNFYFCNNKEILNYWNDGIPEKPLRARETNKALVVKE